MVEKFPEERLLRLKVVEIEPEHLWDYSRWAYKAVRLENGLRVKVAPNIQVGDEVYVHPETGEYLYQVMDRLRPRSGWPWLIRRLKVKVRFFFDFVFMATLFPHIVRRLVEARSVKGEINVAESAFLLMAAEEDFGEGEIVEIGSFQGLSTACLALGNQKPQSRVVSIDPHYFESQSIFQQNLKRLGLTDRVEVHVATSSEVIRKWNRPVRLLWIDGHHEYEFVKQDFELWEPFLIEGGLLLFHDSDKPGVARCIEEFVQASGRFSSIGLFGGITYALKGKGRTSAFLERMAQIQQTRKRLLRAAGSLGLGVERSRDLAARLAQRQTLR